MFLRFARRALLGCLSLPLMAGAAEPARAAAAIDPDQLERHEDLTESLANSLHAFSLEIRQRDLNGIAGHLGPDFSGTDLPLAEGPATPEFRWIEHRPTRDAKRLDRAAFLESWGAYLADFQSMEDVRWKVKGAEFSGDPVHAHAKIKFFWLGRNAQGHREWVTGQGILDALRSDEERWQLESLEITKLDARVATRDAFHEVGLTAGIAQTLPPWGSPGNEQFMAHGVALADVNLDGALDMFLTGSASNFLYVNQGDGRFTDQARDALVAITPPATGPLFLDYDNDGDSDLFLASIGTQMLFENRIIPDGRLEFVEVSEQAGVSHIAEGYSALSADVNADGFPDIYVCSYNKYGQVMPDSWSDARNGTPNLLFLSNGDGTFAEAASAWGVADSRWSYAGHFGDFNGDRRPDLYVANDFGVNTLYIHQGDHFENEAAAFGLDDTGNGMGVSLGDYDNDGLLDVHVTNMSSTAGNRILQVLFPDGVNTPEYANTLLKLAAGNTLFHNDGNGQFRNVSPEAGPFGGGWAFGGGFLDFDNDGWNDLHTPNGFISGKDLKDT
ncbi:MAG: hypothetical protein DHS20C21_11950 [Gemmatimonadota bacterium]|nr:MAG: hypothetical protein DHS20C21_11950 [Gemmatimonadota bacterium]